MVPDAVGETVDHLPEPQLQRHLAVERMTLGVVVLRVRRPPAQLVPGEQVPDTGGREHGLEPPAVERRGKARVRS